SRLILPHIPLSFTNTAPTELHSLSLHDALPIFAHVHARGLVHQRPREVLEQGLQLLRPRPRLLLLLQHAAEGGGGGGVVEGPARSEEHTSELQSRGHLVCRLLLEKKKMNQVAYS